MPLSRICTEGSGKISYRWRSNCFSKKDAKEKDAGNRFCYLPTCSSTYPYFVESGVVLVVNGSFAPLGQLGVGGGRNQTF